MPLHCAAQCGSAGNILILCEAVGGQKLLNVLDSEGFSPVHVACIHGKLGAVRALMAKGGEATLLSGHTGGNTGSSDGGNTGGSDGGLDGIGLAMQAGRIGETVVHFLAKKKNGLTDVRATYGKDQLTPLHLIADGGSVNMFNLLLEASGTDEHSPQRLELLNARDANNQTPLIHCVKHGRGELAAALLHQGAPPLFHELYNADKGWNLLHLACSLPSASPALVATLVRDAGYGVGVEDNTGDSCLHLAAEAGTERVVAALIELGLSVDTINSKDGRTAVHTAAANGQVEVLTTLLTLGGANYAKTSDNQGNTPMALAQYFGHENVLNELKKW